MSTLVVKNLPDHLHERLKFQARRNHRSVTKEVVSLIEAGIGNSGARPGLPAPLKLKSGRRLTIKEIEEAIAEGRD